MKAIFIVGTPCSGKSTIAKQLQFRFGFHHIAVGEIVRQIVDTSNGDLIPSDAIYNIINQKLPKNPSKIAVIDGFPRSTENVLKWELEQEPPICVLHFTCSMQNLNARIAKRLELSQRSDDTFSTMVKRQKIFSENIDKILSFYKNNVYTIDTSESVNEILGKVSGVLAKVFNDKKINFSSSEILTVQRVNEKASLPVKGSSFAAGYDISSCEKVTILPNKSALIKTGICVHPPPGTYIRIAEKSCLAILDIRVCGGVIDPDFSKPIVVFLFNHGIRPFTVTEKMKIAQIVITPIVMATVREGRIEPNNRGGFGSTG